MYQCIWPAWNGRTPITRHWPNQRTLLFHRQRVRCIGVCEQGIIADGAALKLSLVLHHQPKFRTHGLRNIFGKPRTAQARQNVVAALIGSPLLQPRWRYTDVDWPPIWQSVVKHPLRTGLWRLFVWPIRQAVAMSAAGDLPRPSVFLHSGLFHALVCWDVWMFGGFAEEKHHDDSRTGQEEARWCA